MAASRSRLLSLLAAAVAHRSVPAARPAERRAARAAPAPACAGTGRRGAAPTSRSPTSSPASSTSRWSSSGRTTTAAGARPTTRASSTSARTCPTRTSPTSSSCPRAPTPSRSSAASSRKGFDFIIGTSFGYMDPMETVAEEFPDITYLHLTGYKSNGKNFGNFFGAVEDMKYLAGMLAGSRAKKDGNPKIGYMATFPIPEELRLGNAIMRGVKQTCPECTMDVRFINTWHDPQKERDGAASLFDAGADVVFTGADTPAVADVAQEKGKWAVTYDHPTSCKDDACLTAPYWIWGPEYARIAEAGQGQDLQGRLRVLRRRLEGDGPVRLHGRPDAPEGRRRPAGGRRPEGQGHPGQDAGRHVRPVRRLRRADQGQHRQGAPRRPAPSSSSPTSTSSRPAPPATSARPACTGGTRASPASCRRCRKPGRPGRRDARRPRRPRSHRMAPSGTVA